MAVPDYTKVLSIYYPSLCSTLTDIDPLLPRFVAAGVISAPHGFDSIKSQNTILKRVQELLSHISGPLQDGNTAPFYSLLEIMEQHGTQATRQLAEKMRSELNNSVCHNSSMNNHGRLLCATDQLNALLKQQTDMVEVLQEMKQQQEKLAENQEKLAGNKVTRKQFLIAVIVILTVVVFMGALSWFHTGEEVIPEELSSGIEFDNETLSSTNAVCTIFVQSTVTSTVTSTVYVYSTSSPVELSPTVPAKMSTPKSDDKPEPDPNWLVFINNQSIELSTNLSDVLSSHTNQLHTPFYFKISNYFTELKYPNNTRITLYSSFLNFSHVLPKMFMELEISKLCNQDTVLTIVLKMVTDQYDVQQQLGSWFDDNGELRGQFAIQLLNQDSDNDHLTEHLLKNDAACKIANNPRTYTDLGFKYFYDIDSSMYLKDNTVFLRIMLIDYD